ncbi:hypothetical protein [uncultured Alistipes sp.]|jgi:hypothetical protein|uniref:hypothetical protein n=1 Tax=uncultured Alistipes sp. TaxID=538949 RepID=UPI0028037F88|nr:hypothetical protein [uncultured Alistipes sp.]
MRAKVQYNDFLGTSAADISDHRSLDDILREKGVDTDQYKCIGIEVYSGYADYFHVSFLCRDNSTRQGVKISFEKEISRKDFFNMFKRLDVVLTLNGEDCSDLEFNKLITIDDRN